MLHILFLSVSESFAFFLSLYLLYSFTLTYHLLPFSSLSWYSLLSVSVFFFLYFPFSVSLIISPLSRCLLLHIFFSQYNLLPPVTSFFCIFYHHPLIPINYSPSISFILVFSFSVPPLSPCFFTFYTLSFSFSMPITPFLSFSVPLILFVCVSVSFTLFLYFLNAS